MLTEMLIFNGCGSDVCTGTIQPNLKTWNEAMSIRSIQPEPRAAFHDVRLECRHSAFGQDRLYGVAPSPAVASALMPRQSRTFIQLAARRDPTDLGCCY